MSGPAFDHYIGIDYSGAQTPTSSLKGLRVYLADRASPPSDGMLPTSIGHPWERKMSLKEGRWGNPRLPSVKEA